MRPSWFNFGCEGKISEVSPVKEDSADVGQLSESVSSLKRCFIYTCMCARLNPTIRAGNVG
jgi:hypothetical protein